MTRMKTDLHRLLIFKIDIVELWFLLPQIMGIGADGNVEIDDPICEALTLIF